MHTHRRRSEHGLSEEEEEEDEDEDEEDEDKRGDDGAEELEEDNEDGEEEEEEEEVSVAGALGFAHSSSPPGSSGCSGGGASGGAATSRPRAGPSEPRRPSVDVRMIDFAHTTCRDYREDSVVHEGQDSGYIFGLQNLITIISELEEHSSD